MKAVRSAPSLSFMLGGTQKGGTTALAHLMSMHPDIRLPRQKEAHVFDADSFDDDATPQAIDETFATYFDDGFCSGRRTLHGDATPISMFHPVFIQRIARYNPAMKWILILRDPSLRAISHYFMERERGNEHLALPFALIVERWRLKGHEHDFSPDSPLRHHSYIARGRYVRQLDILFRYFPVDQVLLLRNQDLRQEPQRTLDAVFRFLNAAPFAPESPFVDVFSGNWQQDRTARFVRPWLRRIFASEVRALDRRFGIRLCD